MHTETLPECVERNRRIEEKIDSIINRLDKVNGRYEKHMDESVSHRAKIERHDEKITMLMWLFVVLIIPMIFLLIKR